MQSVFVIITVRCSSGGKADRQKEKEEEREEREEKGPRHENAIGSERGRK
jgi:hypothetical protein